MFRPLQCIVSMLTMTTALLFASEYQCPQSIEFGETEIMRSNKSKKVTENKTHKITCEYEIPINNRNSTESQLKYNEFTEICSEFRIENSKICNECPIENSNKAVTFDYRRGDETWITCTVTFDADDDAAVTLKIAQLYLKDIY